MKKLTALLSLLGLWLCTTQTAAAAPEYDIELIIFEDASGRYAKSERWQYERPDSAASKTATDTASNTGAESKVRKIGGIGLSKYAKKLKSNKRYNVLVHKAWRQPGLSRKDAVDISIDSRTSGAGTTSAATPGQGNSIHGTVKIVLARYLHIYTDLTYRKPLKNTAPDRYSMGSQQYRDFPIDTHRRMRSKELHYIDHPMVGILVMAWPVERKEKT
jgi:hypothetical protein